MAENPHLIEKEIKSTFDTGYLATGFDARLGAILDDFPITQESFTSTLNSQHFLTFQKVIRELNFKLDSYGLNSFIKDPLGEGFIPTTLTGFFSDVSTIGSDDFLQLEDGSFLVQQNSSKLVIVPDN